jgi:hypothetical protein
LAAAPFAGKVQPRGEPIHGPSEKLKWKAAAGAHGRAIGRRYGGVRWGRGGARPHGARQFPSVFTRRARTGTAAPPDCLRALRGNRSTRLATRAPLILLYTSLLPCQSTGGPRPSNEKRQSKPLQQPGRHGTLLLLATSASSFTLDDTAEC